MAQGKMDRRTLEEIRDRLVAALARARAEDEDAAESSLAEPRRLRFGMLAAASGARRLPPHALHVREGWRLQAEFGRATAALAVTLEAQGAPSIRRLRERRAHLSTPDGRVGYDFRFDPYGRARLSLSAESEIESSLAQGFDVEIDEG